MCKAGNLAPCFQSSPVTAAAAGPIHYAGREIGCVGQHQIELSTWPAKKKQDSGVDFSVGIDGTIYDLDRIVGHVGGIAGEIRLPSLGKYTKLISRIAPGWELKK